MMVQEDYGRKLVLDHIWDLNRPQDYQHFDPLSHNGGLQAGYEMYFHYEGQRRKRKLVAIMAYFPTPESPDGVSSPDAFRDIQRSIWENTIEIYSRGFKTPSAFYRYYITVPPVGDLEK